MNSADSAERHPRRSTRALARVLLTIYGISLAIIALWPVPVDSGASGFLRRVANVVPVLTYARIEFSANILLFVPLGLLLMLILRTRYLILPIALVVTVAIECSQALLLDRRTPSVLDIIANVSGACVGMLIVAAIEWQRGRTAERMPRPARRDGAGDPWTSLGLAVPAEPHPAPSKATGLPSWIPPMPPPPATAASPGVPVRPAPPEQSRV